MPRPRAPPSHQVFINSESSMGRGVSQTFSRAMDWLFRGAGLFLPGACEERACPHSSPVPGNPVPAADRPLPPGRKGGRPVCHDPRTCSLVPRRSFGFLSSVSTYFSSEWSFAWFKGPDVPCICAFGPDDASIFVVASNGQFLKLAFHPGSPLPLECR